MASFPDTRASLILQIADVHNVQAWGEFAQLYQPVVYRLARQRGFQHADAEELVQEVMLAVARAIERFAPEKDGEAGRRRFRDWLHRIARNLMVNFLTRRKHQVWGSGKTDMQRLLEAECDADSPVTQMFEVEFRRQAFRQAADLVRQDVSESTWQAFWQSTIEDRPAGEVARELNMSVGSVYIARSRVMARLRVHVREIEARA